jgi:hypothetical protein
MEPKNTNQLTKDIVVICPHCQMLIEIEQLNCRIFRHGTLKHNGQQINPHETKEVCDYFAANNMIYGCGKPFQIIVKEDTKEFIAVICEYI